MNTLVQQFYQDGVNTGIEQGERRGEKRGIEKGMVLVATRMLRGGMQALDVAKFTGLHLAKVEKLQSDKVTS